MISLDVNFGIPDKKFGPTEEEESRNPRKILSITERYSLPENAEPQKMHCEKSLQFGGGEYKVEVLQGKGYNSVSGTNLKILKAT